MHIYLHIHICLLYWKYLWWKVFIGPKHKKRFMAHLASIYIFWLGPLVSNKDWGGRMIRIIFEHFSPPSAQSICAASSRTWLSSCHIFSIIFIVVVIQCKKGKRHSYIKNSRQGADICDDKMEQTIIYPYGTLLIYILHVYVIIAHGIIFFLTLFFASSKNVCQ